MSWQAAPVGARSVLALLLLATGGCGEVGTKAAQTQAAALQSSREALPIGTWAVADVAEALSRVRPLWSDLTVETQRDIERSFRTHVVEFQSDGALVVRDGSLWLMHGVWRHSTRGTNEVDARVISSRWVEELTAILFRIRDGNLYVVSQGVEILMKRT